MGSAFSDTQLASSDSIENRGLIFSHYHE